MMRIIRAFFKALALTLRGESLVPFHFRALETWIDEAVRQLRQLFKTADDAGIQLAQRQAIQLKLDGRMTSLEQTLQMLRHNLVNEYPRLIRLDDPYSMMVVQSINMNDQYRVSQFIEGNVIDAAELQAPLAALKAHLQNLPPLDEKQRQE